jgi:tRNA dimethylallyltransferase
MMEAGLLAEVEALLPFRDRNALQTVGYTELFGYFDGTFSLDEAMEKIRQNTRRYAKRQLTWFRKDQEIRWIENFEDIPLIKTSPRKS